MPRIHYDEENINTFVIPNLNNSIENLNTAINYSRNINVTADLACKNELNELDNFLTSEKNNIENIKGKLERSHTISAASCEELKQIINDLPQIL